MAQDAVPIAQVAEEPADMISEQQPQHRRLKGHPHSAKDENDGKESEDRRHLSPETMMGSMKSMAASYPVNPAQNVQLACPKEIVQYCYSEALDAIATSEKSANPDDVRSALRNVNMCLVRDSHVLSQPCLATLMESLQLPPAPPMFSPVPTQTYSATAAGGWTPPVPGNTGEYRGGGYPDSDREKHHKRGHKRFRHNDDSDGDGGSGVHPAVLLHRIHRITEKGHRALSQVAARAPCAVGRAARRGLRAAETPGAVIGRSCRTSSCESLLDVYAVCGDVKE